jgi:hypothetical protein
MLALLQDVRNFTISVIDSGFKVALPTEKLPDETKKDLVVAVQEFLKDNEDVLRYFRSSRKAS